MLREHFCRGCGLFHWVEQYREGAKGSIYYVPYQGCPNRECISNDIGVAMSMPVDTVGFAHFSKSAKNFINEVKWSSSKYAPDNAIEIYRKQGVEIRG